MKLNQIDGLIMEWLYKKKCGAYGSKIAMELRLNQSFVSKRLRYLKKNGFLTSINSYPKIYKIDLRRKKFMTKGKITVKCPFCSKLWTVPENQYSSMCVCKTKGGNRRRILINIPTRKNILQDR